MNEPEVLGKTELGVDLVQQFYSRGKKNLLQHCVIILDTDLKPHSRNMFAKRFQHATKMNTHCGTNCRTLTSNGEKTDDKLLCNI